MIKMGKKSSIKWTNFVMSERCPRCSQLYTAKTRPPIALTCDHNLCGSCIKESYFHQCPICCTPIPSYWKFPKNKAMISLDYHYVRTLNTCDEVNKYGAIIEDFKQRIKDQDVNYNKQLTCIAFKTDKMIADILVFENIIKKLRMISTTNSKEIFLYNFVDPFQLMVETQSEYNNYSKRLGNKVNALAVLPDYESVTVKFNFENQSYQNLLAIGLSDDAYVGQNRKGSFAWAKITRVEDELLISNFRKDVNVSMHSTLVRHEWLLPYMNLCATAYLEFELHSKHLDYAKYPTKFKIYVRLSPDFMNTPIAKQFYSLCLGETGPSFSTSKATVDGNMVYVTDGRTEDVLPVIPDSVSVDCNVYSGAVLASRSRNDYSNFYIQLRSDKCSKEMATIGYVFNGLENFLKDFEYAVKDCGVVIDIDNYYEQHIE